MAQKSAVVQIVWPKDDGAFFRLLVDALAMSPDFRGTRPAALHQPVHVPAISFYRKSTATRVGETVKLIVTTAHSPNQTPEFKDVHIAYANAQANARSPLPLQMSGPAAQSAEFLINFLEPASKDGTSKAVVDLVVNPLEVDLRRYQAFPDGSVPPRPTALSARRAVTSLFSQLAVAQNVARTSVFTATFEVSGGEWVLRSWARVGTVEPRTAGVDAAVDEGRGFTYTDEGEAIVEDIKAQRRLVLSTAAQLIAEQDPTRLDNMLWSIAPFAIFKVGKIARFSKAAILRKIRVPKAIQLVQGRYHVPAKLNTQLVERALELRKTKYGVQVQDFQTRNVSVWHVTVDGKEQIIDAGNMPAGALNRIHGKGDVDLGFHSEGLIAEELRKLEAQGKKVRVHQIYTERAPCPNCARLLDKYGNSPIFHSLRPGDESKAEKLMEAYGVAP